MSKKQNPFLAAYEAKLEAKYRARLEVNSEFDLIAFMKTVHEELEVGPGRAGRVFDAFLRNKMQLAEDIHEDYGDKENGDKELVYTKARYAALLRRIFSPADWREACVMFPLLKDFWK